jgi:hypothetical protein
VYSYHAFSTVYLIDGSRSATVSADGKEFPLTPEMLTIEKKTFKQSGPSNVAHSAPFDSPD